MSKFCVLISSLLLYLGSFPAEAGVNFNNYVCLTDSNEGYDVDFGIPINNIRGDIYTYSTSKGRHWDDSFSLYKSGNVPDVEKTIASLIALAKGNKALLGLTDSNPQDIKKSIVYWAPSGSYPTVIVVYRFFDSKNVQIGGSSIRWLDYDVRFQNNALGT